MKRLFTLLLSTLLVLGATAQDLHYSQYWGAPTSLNPALTGVFNGMVRVNANYRNQWLAQKSFTTYAAGVDFSFSPSKLNGSMLGAGLSFYQDIEGQGAFSNTSVQFSLAYNQMISSGKTKHFFGLGLQTGMLSKQVNLKNVVYGNLFEINQNIDPLDGQLFDNKKVLDVSAGLQYFANFKEDNSVSVGVSIFHLAQPDIALSDNTPENIYRRLSINSSANLQLSDTRFRIAPTFLFQKQGPHQEINTGSYFGTRINDEKETTIYIGAMYRLAAYENSKMGSDAFIASVRLEHNGLDLGVSYDVTTSDLRKSQGFMGGPEIYFIYSGGNIKTKSRNKVYCPKF